MIIWHNCFILLFYIFEISFALKIPNHTNDSIKNFLKACGIFKGSIFKQKFKHSVHAFKHLFWHILILGDPKDAQEFKIQ